MKKVLSMVVLLTALTGCQTFVGTFENAHHKPKDLGKPPVLTAMLYSTDGNMTPHGSVNFYNTDQGVQAYGEVTKLMPNHTYAMHIHEKGKCGNNGEDSGGHFNPYNTKHGHPYAIDSHAGDMPNITADITGIALVNFVNKKISTNQTAMNDIHNRAIIIHAKSDDYVSQPAGNAGDRVVCGVIK